MFCASWLSSRVAYQSADIGLPKVAAYEAFLQRINPDVKVTTLRRDVNSLSDRLLRKTFAKSNLVLAATDSFPAQARLNQISQDFAVPLLAIGIYPQGIGGEVAYSWPGVSAACARCIWSSRYAAFFSNPQSTQAASDGGTILDLRLPDAVAGQLAVGILTRGADNRYGRLIESLGDRNFFIIRNSPEFHLGEPDLFARYLGQHSTNFAFSTLALAIDPVPSCPDCAKSRLQHPHQPSRLLHEEKVA